MGRGRSLLILVVIALGLGAYVYFVEMKRDTSAPEKKSAKVFTVESGKIAEVEVHNSTGIVTTIRKTNDAWSVVAPVASAADMQAVGSLVGTLETLEIQKTIDENPSSVAPYGLEPPRYSLTFKIEGDPAPHAQHRRQDADRRGHACASKASRSCLRSPRSPTARWTNQPFDLRDKTVMKFEREGLDAITLRSHGRADVTLARRATTAHHRAHRHARRRQSGGDADQPRPRCRRSPVNGGAPNAPPPTPGRSQEFGLDKPQLVATFGAVRRATLALGGRRTTRSTRATSRPLIFAVEKTLLDDLKKKADDAAEGTYSRSDPSRCSARHYLCRHDARSARAEALRHRQRVGDRVWKLLKPAEKDVNQTGATDLLNSLSSLRAETFADKALASGEDLVVVARYGEAKTPSEERVTLRKSGTTVHAIRAGDSSAAVLPVADFDKAVAQLKELTGTK